MYEGWFRNNRRHGAGRMILPIGSMYVGNWVDDFPDGYGKNFCFDQTYRGRFKDGLPNGFGKYQWNQGEAYVGQFTDGKREGQGE